MPYARELFRKLMFTEMRISHFVCTDDLRTHGEMLEGNSSFAALARRGVFYASLAKLILALRDNDRSGACSASGQALAALNLRTKQPLMAMLARPRCLDDAHATPEALLFLEEVRLCAWLTMQTADTLCLAACTFFSGVAGWRSPIPGGKCRK